MLLIILVPAFERVVCCDTSLTLSLFHYFLSNKMRKKRFLLIRASLEVCSVGKCSSDHRKEEQGCWQMTHSTKLLDFLTLAEKSSPQYSTTAPLFPNWRMVWPNFLPRDEEKEGTTCAQEIKWAKPLSSVVVTGQWRWWNTDAACLRLWPSH